MTTDLESAFLHGKATEARQHVGQSLAALPGSVRHAVSPRAWTRRFPLPAVAATTLGVLFVALAVDHRLHRPPPVVGAVPKRPRRSRARPVFHSLVRRFLIGPLKAALFAQLRGLI